MGFYQTQVSNQTGTNEILPQTPYLSQEEEATVHVASSSAGRIVVYGDSNCADNSHMQKGLISTVFM